MKFSLSLSLVLLLAVSAVAQTPPPPTVVAISPTSGPVSGGTTVTIVGEGLGLPPNFACILPCPAKVTFDGILAELRDEKDHVLVVVTPPHAAATVDVKITTGDGRTVTLPSAYTYVSAIEATFETLLLPVYIDGTVAGAGGSQWRTDFIIRNNSSDSVALAPWPCEGQVCPPVFPPTRTLRAGETLRGLAPFFRPPAPNVSRLLWVSKPYAKQLSTHLRLYNAAMSALDAGTEIPVIREKDLLVETTQLHGIPAEDAGYRVMLRIYDVGRSESRFLLRFFEEAPTFSTAPFREVEVTATVAETGEFKSQAAYGAYDQFRAPIVDPLPPREFRVEIQPLSQGSRYWAFVSVTNNVTQRVTLITPQ
jgi:hypothetical protein